jgi:hypothetical protein
MGNVFSPCPSFGRQWQQGRYRNTGTLIICRTTGKGTGFFSSITILENSKVSSKFNVGCTP